MSSDPPLPGRGKWRLLRRPAPTVLCRCVPGLAGWADRSKPIPASTVGEEKKEKFLFAGSRLDLHNSSAVYYLVDARAWKAFSVGQEVEFEKEVCSGDVVQPSLLVGRPVISWLVWCEPSRAREMIYWLGGHRAG